LSVGTHSITATYNGDTNNATSTSTAVSQVVNKATTNTAFGSSQNPSTFNQSVTFTATVTGQSPTGNVTFKDGATVICGPSVTLSAGSAACAISTLTVGTHSITATYNGDANNATSASSPLIQTVNTATAGTALASSQNPSTFNQSVTFTATVTGQSPTGNVTFKDGATVICGPSVTLSAGSAACAISTLSVGTHSITATYNGDGNNAASTSPAVSQVVNKATTNTALGSSQNPNTFNQSVTFTATVTGQSPTGNVTFKDGATVICGPSVALTAGSAACAISTLSVGTHSITATYNGDTNNATSTSTAVSQVVNKVTTTTVLSTNCMTTFVENQPFTLTAAVGGLAPTGAVTFNNGAAILCGNVALSSASADCTVSNLAVVGADHEDQYNLTASYGGDGNNAPSNSNPITVTVLSAGDVVSRSDFEQIPPACPVE